MTSSEETGNGLVIRDRRRIDPVTGQVRQPGERQGEHAAPRDGASPAAGREEGTREPGPAEPAADAGPGGPASAVAGGEEVAALREQLAERTADLQRVQAEYANYRKRVDRDRGAVREFALFGVLTDLLPVLDAIGRARQNEELSGGFKSVAESLESAMAKLGLVAYGEKGEPFDPKIHEALAHMYSPDVTEVTCVEILQPGYKVGDRILRPARVAVAEPATGPDGIAESPAAAAGGLVSPEMPAEPGNAEAPETSGAASREPGQQHH